MEKYTDARFYNGANSNNHNCANDGTCGQSIRDFKIGDSDIFFYDQYGRTIAQIPRLPEGNSVTYYNNLYKSADSKKFYQDPKYIEDVLPNKFNYKCKDLDFKVNFDSLSQSEQNQVKMDIQSSYDAYKAKFCIDGQEDVQIYIFNNRDDYKKYGTLIPRFTSYQDSINSSGGMACVETLMCYKNSCMDNVLAHELGHVFQFKFSTAKVHKLDSVNSQLMANAIGLEVEEKNHKAILEQKGVDEYREFDGRFEFQYRGTTYHVRNTNLSKEEKDQLIQDIKSSHESLISEYHRLCEIPPHKNATVIIYVDEDKGVEKIYYHNLGNKSTLLNKALISRSTSEESVEEESNEVVPPKVAPEQNDIEEYNEFIGVFEFKYKGVQYNVRNQNLSEEEKAQFIYDIKNSHESLINEYQKLFGVSSSKSSVCIIIKVDSNTDVEQVILLQGGTSNFMLVDTTLISRSTSEEEVEKEQSEVTKNQKEQEEESNEVGSEEQNKVEEEKSSQQETPQQPSGFLSNIIESVVGSISSFFSWVFGSYKEETQQLPAENLSLLKPIDDDEQNYDAGKSYVDMPHEHNHYHSSDELM